MNANAEKWVAALRSGRFKQAQHKLAAEGGYCCLGVACVLYAEETPGFEWSHDEKFLPSEVQAWLGLKNHAGNLPYNDDDDDPFRESLAIENDAGADFDRIAEIIEAEPAGLFV